MKKLLFLIFFPFSLLSQTIDHWETAVFENDYWKYYVGISEPDSNWRTVSFNDSLWQNGQGGFGYGDGDDATIVPNAMSVFIRNTFEIDSADDILEFLLHIDYDDAFVAYLNGIEIARNKL